jgi:hypothetical protein
VTQPFILPIAKETAISGSGSNPWQKPPVPLSLIQAMDKMPLPVQATYEFAVGANLEVRSPAQHFLFRQLAYCLNS